MFKKCPICLDLKFEFNLISSVCIERISTSHIKVVRAFFVMVKKCPICLDLIFEFNLISSACIEKISTSHIKVVQGFFCNG